MYVTGVKGSIWTGQSREWGTKLKACWRWQEQLRWAHGFLWSERGGAVTLSACNSLTALPLPGVPFLQLQNKTANLTIEKNPHLFKIVTPINIEHFKSLLSSHPNRDFVNSVC